MRVKREVVAVERTMIDVTKNTSPVERAILLPRNYAEMSARHKSYLRGIFNLNGWDPSEEELQELDALWRAHHNSPFPGLY